MHNSQLKELPMAKTGTNFFYSCVLILFIYLFIIIIIWLRWVFVAARRLSLVAVSGGYSLLWCTGLSL